MKVAIFWNTVHYKYQVFNFTDSDFIQNYNSQLNKIEIKAK